jgi:hypothetical protein
MAAVEKKQEAWLWIPDSEQDKPKEPLKEVKNTQCPTCKKTHLCDKQCVYSKTGCKWLHQMFDDLRDQEYTKLQCIQCDNKDLQAQLRREMMREDGEDEFESEPDYTACDGNCGYCGQCDY